MLSFKVMWVLCCGKKTHESICASAKNHVFEICFSGNTTFSLICQVWVLGMGVIEGCGFFFFFFNIVAKAMLWSE